MRPSTGTRSGRVRWVMYAMRAQLILALMCVWLLALSFAASRAGATSEIVEFVDAPYIQIGNAPVTRTIRAITGVPMHAYNLRVDYDETIIDVIAVEDVSEFPGTKICPTVDPDADLGGRDLTIHALCGVTQRGGPSGLVPLIEFTAICLRDGTSPLTFLESQGARDFESFELLPQHSSIRCAAVPEGVSLTVTPTPVPTATATPTPTIGTVRFRESTYLTGQTLVIEATTQEQIEGYAIRVAYDQHVIDVTAVENVFGLAGGGIPFCTSLEPDAVVSPGGPIVVNIDCGTSPEAAQTGTFDLASITVRCNTDGLSPLRFIFAEGRTRDEQAAFAWEDSQVVCEGVTDVTPLPIVLPGVGGAPIAARPGVPILGPILGVLVTAAFMLFCARRPHIRR